MKLSTFLPTLVAVFLIIILFCALSLLLLPDIVPTGMKQVDDVPINFERSRETTEFKVLKATYDFPLFHPFHQSIFQSFINPIMIETDKKLIIEAHPNGKFGNEEQIFKGLLNNTLEIGLLPIDILGEQLNRKQLKEDMRFGTHFNLSQILFRHKESPFFKNAAEVEVLAIIDGPKKAVWFIEDTFPGSQQIALTSHENAYIEFIRSRNLTPVISSIHDLPRILREKRFRYIELGYIEWFYQGQALRENLSLVPGTERTEQFLLLINNGRLKSLSLEEQKIIQEYAQLFANHASNLIEQTEQEILISLSDAEHHSRAK